MNYFVDVIVPISLPKPFTYIVSKKEFDFLDIGHRVIVPFGKSKLYTSIIIKKHEVYPKTYEPKNIEFIFDEKPLVTSDQLKIWSWISDYYLCNLGDVMRASIPSGLILSSETVFTKKAVDRSIVNSFTDDEYLIYEALQKNELRLNQINKILFKKKSLPILNRMISKGYIKSKIELFNKYKPKYIKYFRLNNRYKSKEKINEVIKETSKYSKQKDIIEFFIKTNINSESWINSSLLKKKSGFSLSSIKSLLKKGIIDEKSFQEDRVIFSEIKKKEKLKL
jgi:primosomal protein N' (replication factor Y)